MGVIAIAERQLSWVAMGRAPIVKQRGDKFHYVFCFSPFPALFQSDKLLILLAPEVGLEPTTLRLTAECSAIELLRSVLGHETELLAFAKTVITNY